MLAGADANGSSSDDYVSHTTIWNCEKGETNLGSRFCIRTLLLEPGISLEVSAINAAGALAGTFSVAGAPGIKKPAIADGIEFNVNTATAEGRLDVDLGFDPPNEADLGKDADDDDDDLRNWRWHTSVWARRLDAAPLHDEKCWHNTRIVVDFPDQTVRNRYRILLHGSNTTINWIDQFDTEELGIGGDPKRYRVRLKIRTMPTSDPAKLKPIGDPPFVSVVVVPKHPSIAGIVNGLITQDFTDWMASTPILRVWVMPAPKAPIPTKLFFVYHNSPGEILFPEKFERQKIKNELDARLFPAGLPFLVKPESGPFPEVSVTYDADGDGTLDIDEWETIETHPQTRAIDISGNRSVPIYIVRNLIDARGQTYPERAIAINAKAWEDPNLDNFVTASRGNSARERTIAHEMGHYFRLSTRRSGGDGNELHDNSCSVQPIRIPSTATWPPPDSFATSPLMKGKGSGFVYSGTWLRWEDWLEANKAARQLFGSNFDP